MGWRIASIVWAVLGIFAAYAADDIRSTQYFMILGVVAWGVADIKAAITKATPHSKPERGG